VTAISVPSTIGFRAQPVARRGWPWFTTLLILVGFLLAVHDPYASQKWQENAQADVKQLVQDEESGRLERQIGMLLLGAVGVGLLVRRTENPWNVSPLVLLPLMMLILWAVMSAAWSPEPAISFKRVVALICGVVLAVGLVRQFEMERLAEMAFVHGLAVTLIGIVAEIVLWRSHAYTEEYRFAGTVHPNHAGATQAVLLLCCMYLGWAKSDRRFILFAFFALSMLLLTRSRTAMVSAIAGAAVFVALVWGPRQKLALFLILVSVVATTIALDVAGAFSNLEQTVLLNRANADPTTLTGRTVIWGFALEKLGDDPTRLLTGFGYGGFWTKEMVADLDSRTHFKLAEGHNAFLDLILQGGMIGLFLYLWGVVAATVSLMRQSRRLHSVAAAFALAILGFALTHHLAESGLLEATFPSLMLWMALAVAAFRMPRKTVMGGMR
jgi:O-antigen ligase